SIPGTTATNVTYQRVGYHNHHNNSDWKTNLASMGTANLALSVPFLDGEVFPVSPAGSTSFVNGIWSGNITLHSPAASLVLIADDGNGHTGRSTAFNVDTNSPPI